MFHLSIRVAALSLMLLMTAKSKWDLLISLAVIRLCCTQMIITIFVMRMSFAFLQIHIAFVNSADHSEQVTVCSNGDTELIFL